MSAEHPLSDILSATDLERLARGTCLTSGGSADAHVARRLTGLGHESDPWLLCLREWFHLAASHGPDTAAHYKRRFRSGVDSMKGFCQPADELRVAYFLERQQGFRLKYIPTDSVGGRRTPEFEVSGGSITILVEVKTIGDHPWGGGTGFLGGVRSRADAIRDAIKDAVGQFDKARHNLLIVVDQDRPPIPPCDVIDALRGTECLSFPYVYEPNGSVSDGAPRVQRDRDGGVGPKSNTRVGAIGVLASDVCVESRAFFVHNKHAAKPVPPEPFDPWPQLAPELVPRNSSDDYWQ